MDSDKSKFKCNKTSANYCHMWCVQHLTSNEGNTVSCSSLQSETVVQASVLQYYNLDHFKGGITGDN